MYVFTLFAYFFVRIAKTDKESFLQDKVFGTHVFYLCLRKKQMNYTTYLFDFDYTLADSSRGIVTCFRNVLNRHGYTRPTDNDIKRTMARRWKNLFPFFPV